MSFVIGHAVRSQRTVSSTFPYRAPLAMRLRVSTAKHKIKHYDCYDPCLVYMLQLHHAAYC